MNKYICTSCGYAYEGTTPPAFCPQCKAPEIKFRALDRETRSLPDEHRIGVIDGISKDIIDSLKIEYNHEINDAAIYMAMSRQADREGFPEIAAAYTKLAFEELDHAAKFAEILGEALFSDTKKNLEIKAELEFKDSERKKKLELETRKLGYDAIHDVVHEACKDEARHYNVLKGLRERYF